MLDMTYTALVMQRALYAAAKLGIADCLQDDEGGSDEIAQVTGTQPEALYRLLRVLATGGVLVESADRRFRLTALGATLRSDLPGSMRDWVVFSGEPFYLQAWEEILHSIKTGEAAWQKVNERPWFGWLGRQPDAAAIFDAAMTSLSAWEGPAIVAAYDFSPFRCIVDVGGGHGTLLAAILTTNPGLQGVLYDQAQKLEEDRARINPMQLTRDIDRALHQLWDLAVYPPYGAAARPSSTRDAG